MTKKQLKAIVAEKEDMINFLEKTVNKLQQERGELFELILKTNNYSQMIAASQIASKYVEEYADEIQ